MKKRRSDADDTLALLSRRWALEEKISNRVYDELGDDRFTPKEPRVPSTATTLVACGLEALPARMTPTERDLELERVTNRLEAWTPFEPWFVAFAVDGYGDSYGLFCYPPALEKKLGAPVVRFDHETHSLAWVARDWSSFAARKRDVDSAAKRALRRLMSFKLPARWRAELAQERKAAKVAVDMDRPIGRSKVEAFERVVRFAESHQWPRPLVARATAQLGIAQKELAFERRAHPIRLRVWLRHPEVFEFDLEAKRTPPDER